MYTYLYIHVIKKTVYHHPDYHHNGFFVCIYIYHNTYTNVYIYILKYIYIYVHIYIIYIYVIMKTMCLSPSYHTWICWNLCTWAHDVQCLWW